MGIVRSDGKTSMNVKEMLKSGTTPDEMRKMLESEIKSAQEEIELENRKKVNECKRQEAREEVIDSVFYYLDILGVLDVDDLTDEDYEKCHDALKEVEKSLNKIGESDDFDTWIIRSFLKNL